MNDFEDTVRQVCWDLRIPYDCNHKDVDYYHEITWPYLPTEQQIKSYLWVIVIGKKVVVDVAVMGNDYILMIEVLK